MGKWHACSSHQYISYHYDNNGNQIEVIKKDGTEESESIAYDYDEFNRLIHVTEHGMNSQYTYNMDGLRSSKNVNGMITKHIWDGTNIVLEQKGAEATTAVYTRGINLIAYENKLDSVNDKNYYIYNAHGDVVQLTDETGRVVKRYDYDAFGNEVNPHENDTNPFRYCGEYFDGETGSIYLRARYYNPVIGRFITQDTYLGDDSDPLSLNLYTYSNNNPVMYVDPSGHFGILAAVVIGVGIGALIGGGGNYISQGLSKGWDNINKREVAVNAVTSGLSGAVTVSPVGPVGAIGLNAILGGINYYATQRVNDKKVTKSGIYRNVGIGALAGFAGGKGILNGGSVSKEVSTIQQTAFKAGFLGWKSGQEVMKMEMKDFVGRIVVSNTKKSVVINGASSFFNYYVEKVQTSYFSSSSYLNKRYLYQNNYSGVSVNIYEYNAAYQNNYKNIYNYFNDKQH